MTSPALAINNPSLIPTTAKLLKLDVGITTGLYEPPKRLLIICSSHPRGSCLGEIAEPYNILQKKFGKEEGIEFIVASPKGGSIPIESTSNPRTTEEHNNWSSAIRLLSETSNPIIDIQHAHDYDAVYLPGGHAPMFDLVDHRYLKQLLLDFDTQMKPIVAICHGVVGLVNVRRIDAEDSFIHGRILTGFSLEEELSSEKGNEKHIDKNPLILETKLKDQGAIYLKAKPNKEHIVQDGLLLTGQNSASAKQLAYRLGELLEQCASQDYQQINLTSSLPKTLITCHVSSTNRNNSQLIDRLKQVHLEYIQRNQHLIVFSGSTLITESSNLSEQDSSKMIILLATNNLQQVQHFLEHEPYLASKQIFDRTHIEPFKQLLSGTNNQRILNYHVRQELFKSRHHHHHGH